MTQIIDFYTRRELRPISVSDTKMCCKRCGADVWTILQGGKVCCADCDEICPFHLNSLCETSQ